MSFVSENSTFQIWRVIFRWPVMSNSFGLTYNSNCNVWLEFVKKSSNIAPSFHFLVKASFRFLTLSKSQKCRPILERPVSVSILSLVYLNTFLNVLFFSDAEEFSPLGRTGGWSKRCGRRHHFVGTGKRRRYSAQPLDWHDHWTA